MFTLNIQNEAVYFKDIRAENLPNILNWYNKVEDFKYATGIDEPITLHALKYKYAEVSISSYEFFVGIYPKNSLEMIGILKGSLKCSFPNSLWISSLVIDTKHQRQGFGRASMELLINHVKYKKDINEVFLSIVEDNKQGLGFWKSQGFVEVRKMENQFVIQNTNRDVYIYRRIL